MLKSSKSFIYVDCVQIKHVYALWEYRKSPKQFSKVLEKYTGGEK